VRFFSGFSLRDEKELFTDYLKEGSYHVAGFSKGAIDAFEYVLQSKHRIDLLQLFSPAYFMDREDRFKKMQLEAFRKNSALYLRQFLRNIAYPVKKDLFVYLHEEDERELSRLLYYCWEPEKLEKLRKRGVRIEVYLGSKDKIINALAAMDFFKSYATVYLIKEGGHILNGEN
jgi:hypothetical protein